MHWWVKIQVFRNKIPNFLCFSFIFSSFTTIKKKFYGKWEAAGARVTVWITAGRIPGTPTHQAAVPARGLLCSSKKKKKKIKTKLFFRPSPRRLTLCLSALWWVLYPLLVHSLRIQGAEKTKSNGHNPEPCNTDGLCRLNEVHLLINTIKPHCY